MESSNADGRCLMAQAYAVLLITVHGFDEAGLMAWLLMK